MTNRKQYSARCLGKCFARAYGKLRPCSEFFVHFLSLFTPVECRMIQPVRLPPVTTPVCLQLASLTALKQAQSIGYHRATTGNMPFCPISNGLGFETIDHRHPHLDWMSFACSGPLLPQTASCLPRPDPVATTALATPVDIIELNDYTDGLFVIGLFRGLQQLVA